MIITARILGGLFNDCHTLGVINDGSGFNQNELSTILRDLRDQLLKEMTDSGFYLEAVLRHDPIPWDINNGYCEEFGERALGLIPVEEKAECLWLQDHFEDWDEPSHYCLLVHGRFYDAECIEGVDEIRKLPIYLERNRWEGLEVWENSKVETTRLPKARTL